MHSSNTGPEALSRQLRRRHEYTGSPVLEEQQNCRRYRRDPVKNLGNETLQAAREQQVQSMKQLVDHIWEGFQQIKARENDEEEQMETSNRVIQSADYQRSRSTPCRERSPAKTSMSQRGHTVSSSLESSAHQGLSGLNNRYREVRKRHELESRPTRAVCPRDDYAEITQRRNIDAMVNPRADNQQLNSQIRQQGWQSKPDKLCSCRSDSNLTEEDDLGCDDFMELGEYVEAEANRLGAIVKAAADDFNMMSERKERLKPSPTPLKRKTCRPALEPSRSKQTSSRCTKSSRSQPPPPRRCQCLPKERLSLMKPARDRKQSDSVTEIHPFKPLTASGRPWADADSKSTVQFVQIENDSTEYTASTTSCSETPNTEDIEVVEQMLMELESNLQSRHCPGSCSADNSIDDVTPLKNIKQITQMISAENKDVGLALRLARKLPENKTKLSGRCPKFNTSSDVIFPYGELEEMTPELAAKVMEADERGVSAVLPPHKMFACLFPEYAIEPLYEVGSITTKNGLVVPLHGSQYTSPFSQQDIAEMSMMSDAIRPDIVTSNPNTSLANNESRFPERGSLTDSADITGWTTAAESASFPGVLSNFEESGKGALIYTLKPQALATNIRLRGSVKPSWFPGYYMALPPDSKIKLASSASHVLVAAHNAVSPGTFNLPKKKVCQC